ncbi:hypothetical protein [Kitasatospora sp. NPDC058397]
MEITVQTKADEDGLLVAKRNIAAARARSEQPSDVSGGRSDGNDN